MNKPASTEQGVEYKAFLEVCLKFVPQDKKALMTEACFQYCFTHSKIAQPASGESKAHHEIDRSRITHLNFIEFIVFLCYLTQELYKREQRELNDFRFIDYLKEFIELILGFFSLKTTLVPSRDDDTRGNEVPQDLLMNG